MEQLTAAGLAEEMARFEEDLRRPFNWVQAIMLDEEEEEGVLGNWVPAQSQQTVRGPARYAEGVSGMIPWGPGNL